MKTEFVRIDETRPLSDQMSRAAEIIRRGGLVAFPTETVYGLGGNGLNAEASRAIYAAKGRPSDNPLILHIDEPTKAERYAITNETYYALARHFMPGPLTVILPKKDIVPDSTTGGLDSVALRCPENPIAHAFLVACDLPIAAPSANLSGKPSPTTAEHVRDDMDGRIEMILDGGPCEIGVESTIVKITDAGVTLLRPGAITAEMLRAVVPEVSVDPTVTEKPSEDLRPQAPGMKYRHYAPNAPVFLLCDDGTDDFDARAIRFLSENKRDGAGILCFEEYLPVLAGEKTLSLGAKADEKAHAHRLFAALRELDKLPIKAIYATVAKTDGEGLAFYNRMLKASGYHFVTV